MKWEDSLRDKNLVDKELNINNLPKIPTESIKNSKNNKNGLISILTTNKKQTKENRISPRYIFCITVYNEEKDLLDRTIDGIFLEMKKVKKEIKK